MKLRVSVKMTNVRQFEVEVADPDLYAGDLKVLIFAAAKREFGEHDEMRIVSFEEVIGEAHLDEQGRREPEEAPHAPPS